MMFFIIRDDFYVYIWSANETKISAKIVKGESNTK